MTFLRGLPPLSADLRRALRLCLPAAIVAVILRGFLLWHAPAAYVHNDTAAALETAARLITGGAFVLDGKKTFLAPALMCVPAVVHIPVLPFLAVTQHLLGVALVFVVGLLAFAWFRHWRFLLPVATFAVALNPVLLWYEHAALAETLACFGIALVALAATAFWKQPTRATFAFLLAALLWMAGARPEGWLFGLFAVALVVRTCWGQWSTFRVAVPVMMAWAVLLALITRTGQGGLLLFTSVLHLTPPHLTFSPGVAERVAPLVERARAQWESTEPPRLVALRKDLKHLLDQDHANANANANAVSTRAAAEVALRRLDAIPGLALRKFIVAHREPPSGDFSTYPFADQLEALTRGDEDERGLRYAPLMWRESLADEDQARAFLARTYRPSEPLTRYAAAWQSTTLLPLAPLRLPGSEVVGVPVQGLPWLYATAVLGMVALAARERPLGLHQLLGAFLVGLFILIMVTANLRARFRVIFEPLWVLYALALVDTALILLARLRPAARA